MVRKRGTSRIRSFTRFASMLPIHSGQSILLLFAARRSTLLLPTDSSKGWGEWQNGIFTDNLSFFGIAGHTVGETLQ